MSEFDDFTRDEINALVHTAREARSVALAALCQRLWARLTGRVPAPVTSTYA